MCGRYSLSTKNPKAFIRRFGSFDGLDHPKYNRAPGQAHPVVIERHRRNVWVLMNWGKFRNRAVSSPTDFFPINARSETVHFKKIFQESFSCKRCLIPADGWYEWQVLETEKYPFFHQIRSLEPFAFAGIWSEDPPMAFSILTRSAPSELLHIHHRAPLILPESDWTTWLDGQINETEDILPLLQLAQPEIKAYQVSSKVNSSQNEGPDLIRPETGKQSLLF